MFDFAGDGHRVVGSIGSFSALREVHMDKRRTMFDDRTYLKFVTIAERDKQRRLQVRCGTYVADRGIAANFIIHA